MNGQKIGDVSVDTSGLNAGNYKYFMTDLYGMNGTYYVDDLAIYDVNMNGQAP
jgi:hypothetical protein